LESAGHEVLCASDAREGIAHAQAHRPDAILMDIQLPDVDGFEATRRLKNDGRTGGIPIVAVTAHAMREDESRIRSAGCDGYLSKPYRPAELLKVVAGVLPRSEHPRSSGV